MLEYPWTCLSKPSRSKIGHSSRFWSLRGWSACGPKSVWTHSSHPYWHASAGGPHWVGVPAWLDQSWEDIGEVCQETLGAADLKYCNILQIEKPRADIPLEIVSNLLYMWNKSIDFWIVETCISYERTFLERSLNVS